MKIKQYLLYMFVFGLILNQGNLFAQVTIAPTNIFLDNNTSFGTYMVINNSDEPQELSIDFFFGYSINKSDGSRTIVNSDSLLAQEYSVADAIRAFPQNFILQPNQRQIVRLRINPNNNNLEDGTYWARVKTTSTAQTPPVEIDTDNQVSARIGVKFEQITGLYYKNGDISTGIIIDSIRTAYENNNQIINILTDYKRNGNSPFLGSITTTMIDDNGNIIAREFSSTTLFFDGTIKTEFDILDIDPGEYQVQVLFETRRSDISSEDLIQMEPVTATTTVTIP